MGSDDRKKIIVFGATGSIGAYFVDYCKQNFNAEEFEVIAVGRKDTQFFQKNGINYFKVDITKESDFDVLPMENIYAVVNAAGVLPAYVKENDPFIYIDTNISGGLRILEYARKSHADRVLYTQTWSEQAGYWGKKEVLAPNLPRKLLYTGDHAFYAITKTMIVETMEYYKQEFGLKNFVFRLPNVYLYHPNMYYYVDGKPKLTAYRYMIEKAIAGDPIEMWGNPDAFKDILYVKDLCQLMYKALFADIQGGIYNAGTGIKTTLREQIEGIVRVFSSQEKQSEIIPVPEKPGFVSFVMDIENATEELGYVPQYTYLEYLEDYKKERIAKRFDAMWHDK